MRLTKEEQAEFNQLKRDLLIYHELGCKHPNSKKDRYNELWDKNKNAFFAGISVYAEMEKN